MAIIESDDEGTGSVDDRADEDADRLLPDAIEVIREYDRASASLLQRRLKVGYARAARIIDQLEARGYIGAFVGSNVRQVLRHEGGAATQGAGCRRRRRRGRRTMTTRDETRRGTADLRPESGRADAARESSRDAARDAVRDGSDEPSMSLPERLYAARERKGVALYRAERDTKIRARYLAALERGDYRELPGAVYTKGFLRNYALYLGLEPGDPQPVAARARRRRGAAAVIAVPQPLNQPRRG
jgi:hypothetical protein